jgi:hypothetical protein
MNGLGIFAYQPTFSSSTPTDLSATEQQHFNNVQVSIKIQSLATESINEFYQFLHYSAALCKADVWTLQLRDAKFHRISADASIDITTTSSLHFRKSRSFIEVMRSENGTYLLRWQVRPNSFWAVSRRGW